jgi:hypothetical protein
MLAQARTHAALPAADVDRARRFYEGTRFLVFPSAGRASGTHTQLGVVQLDAPS